MKLPYVVDDKGKAVSVFLDIKTYRKLLAEIEKLESICVFDIVNASCDEVIKADFQIKTIFLTPC